MLVRRIHDAHALLWGSPGGADRANRTRRRAAQFGVLFQEDCPRSAARGADRCREPRSASAYYHYVRLHKIPLIILRSTIRTVLSPGSPLCLFASKCADYIS